MDMVWIRTNVVKNWRIALAGVVVFVVGIVIGAAGVYGFLTMLDSDVEGDSDIGIEGAGLDGAIEGAASRSESEGDCPGGMWVDIAGAVQHPGVYCAEGGWVMETIIAEAGGYTDDACFLVIEREFNRAQLLEPNSKTYIPFQSDALCRDDEDVEGTSGTALAGDAATEAAGACDGGKVNINTAAQGELEALTGVGPVTAGKIIDGRPYGKPEDLLNVSGIGQATFEKIQNEICL